MKIKEEIKGNYKNISHAFRYFVPEIGESVKVEKVNHHRYVAHFKEGLESVFLKDMHAGSWKCEGKWEALIENL